jgi:hypothetical protein
MEQPALFRDPCLTLTDDEIAAVLRGAIARGGRLSRAADLYLTSQCVEHLVDELRTECQSALNIDPPLECAPEGGQIGR